MCGYVVVRVKRAAAQVDTFTMDTDILTTAESGDRMWRMSETVPATLGDDSDDRVKAVSVCLPSAREIADAFVRWLTTGVRG